MIEVWNCQVRVLLRAHARFRRLVPPWGASLQLPENPDTATRTHESLSLASAGVNRGVGPDVLISTRIDKRCLRRQHPHADQQRTATVWTRERGRWGVWSGWWLRSRVVGLRHHAPDIRRVDGTAGAHKTKMSYLHEARGQDVLQEPAHKLQDVELGGARACASGFAVRERDDMVLERDNTAVGDGHFEDIRSKVLQGRGAVRIDLAVHVPGGVPDLWGDLFDKPGGMHFFFEDSAVDRRQGLDRHVEIGS